MMIWDTISWCLTIVVWCEIVHQPVNLPVWVGIAKFLKLPDVSLGCFFLCHLCNSRTQGDKFDMSVCAKWLIRNDKKGEYI